MERKNGQFHVQQYTMLSLSTCTLTAIGGAKKLQDLRPDIRNAVDLLDQLGALMPEIEPKDAHIVVYDLPARFCASRKGLRIARK